MSGATSYPRTDGGKSAPSKGHSKGHSNGHSKRQSKNRSQKNEAACKHLNNYMHNPAMHSKENMDIAIDYFHDLSSLSNDHQFMHSLSRDFGFSLCKSSASPSDIADVFSRSYHHAINYMNLSDSDNDTSPLSSLYACLDLSLDTNLVNAESIISREDYNWEESELLTISTSDLGFGIDSFILLNISTWNGLSLVPIIFFTGSYEEDFDVFNHLDGIEIASDDPLLSQKKIFIKRIIKLANHPYVFCAGIGTLGWYLYPIK